MSKKTKEPKPFVVTRTIAEEDAHDLELQTSGARDERTAILRELHRRARQLRELSELADKPGRGDKFAEYARGVEMAYNIVASLPPYEDGDGCRECGVL